MYRCEGPWDDTIIQHVQVGLRNTRSYNYVHVLATNGRSLAVLITFTIKLCQSTCADVM